MNHQDGAFIFGRRSSTIEVHLDIFFYCDALTYLYDSS